MLRSRGDDTDCSVVEFQGPRHLELGASNESQ